MIDGSPATENGWYRSKRLAQILGVNESTLRRWADRGVIGCQRTPGGHRRFSHSQVLEFMRDYHFECTTDSHFSR